MIRLLLLIPALFLFAVPAMAAPKQQPPAAAAQTDFSQHVLWVIKNKMPTGGGYSATKATVNRLPGNAVSWDVTHQRLSISPYNARPSFCSGACYLVLLQALQRWEQLSGIKLPAEAWQACNIAVDQPDGHGVWGRANANGPGLAKLVADIGAGVNFTDPALARPGDFLKIFWTPEIGAYERGHLVVYLGTTKKSGCTHLRFWSANQPGGYGIKTAPLDQMHNLIFTRITAPQNFARVTSLPETDPLLEAMLTRRFTFAQVIKMCRIQRSKAQK